MVYDKFLTKSILFSLSENSITFNKFMILKESELYYRVVFSVNIDDIEVYSYIDLFMGLEVDLIVENYKQTLSDFDYMYNKSKSTDDNVFLNHLYSRWIFESQDYDFRAKSYLENLYCKESDLEINNVKFFNRLCEENLFIDIPLELKDSYVSQ